VSQIGVHTTTSSAEASMTFSERKATLGLLYDYEPWEKTPFIIALPDPEKGQVFKTHEEMLIYTCDPKLRGDVKATQDTRQIIQQISDTKFLRLNPRNTSLGGNEALNCYPAFNEDDDIIHLATAADILQEDDRNPIILSGLGRVYSEVYDTNQKIMYISAGVARYTGVLNFYEKAIDPDMVELIHGTEAASGNFVSSFMTATVDLLTLPIQLMVLPFRYFSKAIEFFKGDTIVSKYYDFWSDMVLYYKHVNEILIHLSVNLGIVDGGWFGDDSDQGVTGVTGSSVQKIQKTADASEREAANASDSRLAEWDMPFFLKEGVDMFKIATRRERFVGNARDRWEATECKGDTQAEFKSRAGQGRVKENDQGLFSPFANFFGKFAQSAWTAATGGDRYIGFRVEKSTDSSESFSNSTGESSVAQKLNSAVSSAREAVFAASNGNISGGGSGIVGTLASGAIGLGEKVVGLGKDIVQGISGLLIGEGSTQFVSNLVSGSAYIDIPEVWTGSQFSKSYSFRMQLRDPHGGNPISFMYNIAVPLACMLGLALPRSAGHNSYGQPFFLRVYCKGMFAIPLGIIDSMTVSRGASEHGWSIYGLPTVVEISFSVKDLATVMHMALSGASPGDAIEAIFSANSPFQEYLLTLSAVGMKERLLFIPSFKRKLRVWSQIVQKNTVLNPFMSGMSLGQGSIMTMFGMFSKYSTTPNG
jgi:hypothetical protein